MQYPETIERSAEHLRQAVARMVRHPAAFHPMTYAVWYEHVSGANAPLSRAIEAHAAPLDDQAIRALFVEHVASTDAAALDRVRGAVHRVADEVAASAQRTGAQANLFQRRLHTVRDALAGRGERSLRHDAGLDELLAQTAGEAQALAESVDVMTARLDQSRREAAELREQLELAREAALTDALTGLPSRARLQATLLALERTGQDASCVLLLDIDRFGQLNEAFGHLFGDRVLMAIARTLRDAVVAPGGLAARWDGEAFAILLPQASLAEAIALGGRLLDAVERLRVRRKGYANPIDRITVSIGVAQRRPAEPSEALMQRAHEALARSKAAGRNRLMVSANRIEPAAETEAEAETETEPQ